MKAVITCLQELSFHIQGGFEEGSEHSTGVPGALKCSLFPSTSWEPSPCVSVGVGCVHGILEWGLCAQAWGLGIKEGPLWNHRVASFLRECSGLATCRPLPGAGSVWSSSQGPAMLLQVPVKSLCAESFREALRLWRHSDLNRAPSLCHPVTSYSTSSTFVGIKIGSIPKVNWRVNGAKR